jgi:hypothetical protein
VSFDVSRLFSKLGIPDICKFRPQESILGGKYTNDREVEGINGF